MALARPRFIAMFFTVFAAPFSTHAEATINLQVYGGSRSTTFEPTGNEGAESQPTGGATSDSLSLSDSFTGMEFGFSALLRPSMVLPVSIGGFVLQQQLRGRGGDGDLKDEVSGFVAGAEAMAWLALGVVEPYARVGIDLHSNHKYKASFEDDRIFGVGGGKVETELEVEGKVSGQHGAVGLRFKATPFIGAFLQADFARERLTLSRGSLTQEGYGSTFDMSDVPEVKLESQSVMIGIDLGT